MMRNNIVKDTTGDFPVAGGEEEKSHDKDASLAKPHAKAKKPAAKKTAAKKTAAKKK